MKLKEILLEIKYQEMTDKEKDYFLTNLRSEVRNRVYARPFLSDPDGDTIHFAKKVAKEHGIPFQDILAGMRPSGKLNRTIWDETGKLVPWKKVFGGY